MREKTLKFLGLMRRASALQAGENNAGEAVRGGKAKLLLLASDASENAKRRAESFVGGRSCLLLALPFTKAELGGALGQGDCSMAAVTELGFANALAKRLAELDPGRFGTPPERSPAAFPKRNGAGAKRPKRETRGTEKGGLTYEPD